MSDPTESAQGPSREKTLFLGRKVLRSRHWRWLPGMLSVSGIRVSEDTPGELLKETCPDLDDAATFGVTIALLKQASDSFYIKPAFNQEGDETWECGFSKDTRYVWSVYSGKTPAEALVAALVSSQ